MQYRCVQIVEVNLAFDRLGAGVVGFAIGESRFHTAAGQPEGEPVGVVTSLVFLVGWFEAWSAETTVVTVKDTRRRKQDRIKVIGIVEWITS